MVEKGVDKDHSKEIQILSNDGYAEAALLQTLETFPRATYLMRAMGLVEGVADTLHFPDYVDPEQEKADPQLGKQGFKRRVGLHTVSVGLTMHTLLTSLNEAKATSKSSDQVMTPDQIRSASEAMIMHDLYKLQEIALRKEYGSETAAYQEAERRLQQLILAAGFSEENAELAGSIGIYGARDFYAEPPEKWSLVRQAAYLSDDLLKETVIQPDITGKIQILKSQRERYQELNDSGFPEMLGSGNERFVSASGQLRPKFDIQEEATIAMADNIGKALKINGSDLGKFLIARTTHQGIYSARVESPAQG